MENNFFVGIVCHSKRIGKEAYREKTVLYKENDLCYVDLLKDISYSTNSSQKDYVKKDTLIQTDISEHKTDYMYLLLKHNNDKGKVKKRNRIAFKVFK